MKRVVMKSAFLCSKLAKHLDFTTPKGLKTTRKDKKQKKNRAEHEI